MWSAINDEQSVPERSNRTYPGHAVPNGLEDYPAYVKRKVDAVKQGKRGTWKLFETGMTPMNKCSTPRE